MNPNALIHPQNTYLTLVRSSKSTSVHTLPSINLMKNSASELFCMDHGAAYQHAFGYIRQLAIHLRNSMKVKSKVLLVHLCASSTNCSCRRPTSKCTTGSTYTV